MPPRALGTTARMAFALVVVVAIILLGAFLTLVWVMGNAGSSTPAGALNGYVNGINAGNVRAALDHTTLRFASDYNQQVIERESRYLNGSPSIKVDSVKTTFSADMSQSQSMNAMDMLDELYSSVSNITVKDYAFIEYTLLISYASGAPATGHGSTLCVEIGGSWYMVLH